MKAKEIEKRFGEGVDLTDSLDLSKVRRVLQEQKRVNVDFPIRMMDSLDRDASRLGVTRRGNSAMACKAGEDPPMKKANTSTTSQKMPALPTGYDSVCDSIVELLNAARQAAARNVNALMTASYWEIGRRIVEAEQKGKHRAGYGEQLIERLSLDLSQRFGRGSAPAIWSRCASSSCCGKFRRQCLRNQNN